MCTLKDTITLRILYGDTRRSYTIRAEKFLKFRASKFGAAVVDTFKGTGIATKPDAIKLSDCAFVMHRSPVQAFHSHSGACATASSGASCAIDFTQYASHGATLRSPVRRAFVVGARRRGVLFYGYQENAGGCHPPGRNTDRRHQRQ